MNPLVGILEDYERPANELDNWMFESNFDFYVEVGVMISGFTVGIGE